jgi:ribosomal protein L22
MNKQEIQETEKKEEKKQIENPVKKKVKKKEIAIFKGINIPISMKYSRDICKFIKGQTIQKAILMLQTVSEGKKAIPMKGEYPHRKGKMASGKYPKNASRWFIKMLKTLSANSSVNGLENPFIIQAIANIGERPYGRFGSIKRKRTHILIKAKDKEIKIEKKEILQKSEDKKEPIEKKLKEKNEKIGIKKIKETGEKE